MELGIELSNQDCSWPLLSGFSCRQDSAFNRDLYQLNLVAVLAEGLRAGGGGIAAT